MTETILLVEDDAPIRRLLRRALLGQGYRLLEAKDGEEALGLAADDRTPIALLVTDVVMPRMDGFTLSKRLVESHPETRVLFLSGQASQSMAVRGGLKESGQACSSRSRTTACCRRFVSSSTDRRHRDTRWPARPLSEKPRGTTETALLTQVRR